MISSEDALTGVRVVDMAGTSASGCRGELAADYGAGVVDGEPPFPLGASGNNPGAAVTADHVAGLLTFTGGRVVDMADTIASGCRGELAADYGAGVVDGEPPFPLGVSGNNPAVAVAADHVAGLLTMELRAVGARAGYLASGLEPGADMRLVARGCWRLMERPQVGGPRYPAVPYGVADQVFDSGSLVPAPGQHDGELPSTLPGLGDSRRQGVIGDRLP